jgi:hypothetical protein
VNIDYLIPPSGGRSFIDRAHGRADNYAPEATMLHEFLSANREEIIARARARAVNRTAPRATDAELENGIPLFLTQLVEMLRTPRPGFGAEIGDSATRHGDDMRRMGFTVGQVVQDYGGSAKRLPSSPSKVARRSAATSSRP